ncbi:hypothetical protein B0H17DRAFT_1117196 [Mycena rosella]|uniref:Uncharacterized protein n=1 Tax=Mycena rosella TaxID=1033263 RepID=A0AAD7FAL9_MYCRO|nr:hypothetical protein B0H17DRAFT_1117196 [Mycena rosella]
MSKISIDGGGITEKRFAYIPAIPGFAPEVIQAEGSGDTVSTKTTGSLRSTTRQDEIHRLLTMLQDVLKVIPTDVMLNEKDFSLEHDSNRAWMTPMVHKHHDLWATVAISPCLADLVQLEACFTIDNLLRKKLVDRKRGDPGRSNYHLTMINANLTDKYEFIVLHPAHFLIDGEALKIRGDDGLHKDYYVSLDGVLKDGQNVPLPLFTLRQPRADAKAKLNPTLVNFAAAIRFRRFRRMSHAPLGDHAEEVIDASLKLWEAILWKPTPPEAGAAKISASTAVEFGSADRTTATPLTLSGPHSEDRAKVEVAGGGGDGGELMTELMLEWTLGGYGMSGLFYFSKYTRPLDRRRHSTNTPAPSRPERPAPSRLVCHLGVTTRWSAGEGELRRESRRPRGAAVAVWLGPRALGRRGRFCESGGRL